MKNIKSRGNGVTNYNKRVERESGKRKQTNKLTEKLERESRVRNLSESKDKKMHKEHR